MRKRPAHVRAVSSNRFATFCLFPFGASPAFFNLRSPLNIILYAVLSFSRRYYPFLHFFHHPGCLLYFVGPTEFSTRVAQTRALDARLLLYREDVNNGSLVLPRIESPRVPSAFFCRICFVVLFCRRSTRGLLVTGSEHLIFL